MPDPIHTLGSSSHPRIDTDDIDVARCGLRRLYGDSILIAPPQHFEWHVQVANLGPLGLGRGFWSPGIHVEGTVRTYVLIGSAGGVSRTSTRNLVADIVPGRCMAIAQPDVPLSWGATEAVMPTTVRISPQFVTAQLEALTGMTVHQPIVFAPQIHTTQYAGARIERLCALLVDEMAAGSPLDHPIAMMGVCETLVRTLLTHQPHDAMHLLDKQTPPSSQQAVRIAEEYVAANASAPISLTDLVAVTGVNGQSLDAAFRQHGGTTPQGFLRSRRLERARQRLLGETFISITQLAHDAVFLRVEAFEAAYLAAFKETCANTRQRGLHASRGVGESPEQSTIAARLESLTRRELEVCRYVGRGMLNKQIAAELGTSEPTIKKQRASAIRKLGVSSTAELVQVLTRMGMLG